MFQKRSHMGYGWVIKEDLNELCNLFAVIIKAIL